MATLAGIKPEFYEEMVTSTQDGLLLVEGHTIVGCNPAACKLYGIAQEELLNTHPAELSPKYQPDGQLSKEKANELMELAISGKPQRFLWQHLRRGVGEFTCEVTLNPARFKDINGEMRPVGFVTLLRDVTEQEKAKRLLTESELRFRSLFEHSPIPMILIRDGCINSINSSFRHLVDQDCCDISLDEIQKLFTKTRNNEHSLNLRQLAEASKEIVLEGEYQIINSQNSTSFVRISLTQISNDTVVSFTDVTDQINAQITLSNLNSILETKVVERTEKLELALESLKKAQAELIRAEKLASLGALVSGVAHELNTPIGIALTAGSMTQDNVIGLEEQVSKGLTKAYLSNFIVDSKQSSGLVTENLRKAAELIDSFKQVAVQQNIYEKLAFNVNSLIDEIVVTFSSRLGTAEVNLISETKGKIPMESYPDAISQVIIHLLENSLNHAFQNTDNPTINIQAMLLDEENAHIIINDNGKGIDDKHLDKVFDPFFTTELGKGQSGLGLHVVYLTVTELLKGTIALNSSKGQGVEVSITIPTHL